MKDRIKQIMESQHMTQQVFANFIDVSPASLSSIFNDRTRPTLNIVEAIKKKIPMLNTDWLMFGTGEMYHSTTPSGDGEQTDDNFINDAPGHNIAGMEMAINFDDAPGASLSSSPSNPYSAPSQYQQRSGHRDTRNQQNYYQNVIQKNIDIPKRNITEIRIYFDDQTYETFVPAKK